MALYVDQYTLSQDVNFQHRVEIAILEAATAVVNQSTPDSGQLALARRAFDDSQPMSLDVAKAIVIDPTVAATAPTGTGLTDAQIQSAVNSILAKGFVR